MARRQTIFPFHKEPIRLIEITRKLTKQIRVIFARCLSQSSRGPFPPVEFHTDQNGLTLRAKSQDAAIEFRQPGEYAEQRFAIPFDVLKQFEGGKAEPIRFEANKSCVAITLPNGRIVAPTIVRTR